MSTAAPATPTTKQATAYRVLKFPAKPAPVKVTGAAQDYATSSGTPTPPGLQDVGAVKAANANAAIRAVAEKNGPGTYVAVPESSWKPQKVTVEQTTVVKVGEPT